MKCEVCRKKIKSVLPIKCKCEKYFCNMHKIPIDHKCKYDYIKTTIDKLNRENPKIKAEKYELL